MYSRMPFRFLLLREPLGPEDLRLRVIFRVVVRPGDIDEDCLVLLDHVVGARNGIVSVSAPEITFELFKKSCISFFVELV